MEHLNLRVADGVLTRLAPFYEIRALCEQMAADGAPTWMLGGLTHPEQPGPTVLAFLKDEGSARRVFDVIDDALSKLHTVVDIRKCTRDPTAEEILYMRRKSGVEPEPAGQLRGAAPAGVDPDKPPP